MDVVGFEVKEIVSKKNNKTYYMLLAVVKNGSKYFIKFVNQSK